MSAEKYTSRLIKASALLSDTKLLLSAWDTERSVRENLDQALQANIFGKASRSRVEDILAIFRQRYFSDPDVGSALVQLVQADAPSSWVDPILYYYAAQNDITLKMLVIELLYPRKMAGHTSITVDQVRRALEDWIAEGRMTTEWSEKTTVRVAQHALAALRDFSVLEGASNKSIINVFLPTEAFSFLALDQFLRHGAGDQVLKSDDWSLFFLPIEGVERFLLEAHQSRLLSYQAAGSTVRLEFPSNTREEYALDLLER